VYRTCFIGLVCLLGCFSCLAQEGRTVATANLAEEARPVPVLSGGLAFVPTWDNGAPTLVSIIAPVLLLPVGSKALIESRASFEGDFQRRNGTSGDFTGAVEKSLDYLELDYTLNRYVTITAGRFLTPFNIYNERLYPNWIRNTQTDPLIFPLGTGSDNGAMLRGGIAASKNIIANYSVYYSALSTTDHFESERHAGLRSSIFLPRQRLELGMSVQHQLQDGRQTRYGLHTEWQPRRVPLDLRAEGAYSREEGKGFWVEGAYRLSDARPSFLRRAQLVARTQFYGTGSIVGIDPDLPTTDEKRTEVGLNYYLNDGWKALASYGRTFAPAGESNIWTIGMTYRFVKPLGRRQ
jgi:hypothetical protein